MGSGSHVPKYAILSHTWEDGEVTFQDFTHPDHDVRLRKKGFRKIQMTCNLAEKAGLKYAWIDTCCIDKTSSAELTEAINSMFQWYRDAVVCYAWLADLPKDQATVQLSPGSRLKNCRWFTRGWTLQELIAPRHVEFYDQEWNLRGTKADLSDMITEITKISGDVLRDPERLYQISVAQRMSWAATRQTTRIEDIAYCMLGIFDVNMPMLYGEGSRAFIRLQEEIAKDTNDFSLFAWRASSADQTYRGVFAITPAEFRDSGSIQLVSDTTFNPEFLMTNKGLRMNASINAGKYGAYFLGLNCSESTCSNRQEVGIWIKQHGGGVYSRIRANEFGTAITGQDATVLRIFLSKRINAARSRDLEGSHRHAFIFRKGFNEVGATHSPEFPFEANNMVPRDEWDSQRHMFLTHGASNFAAYGYFTYRFGSTDPEELMGGEAFLLAFGRTHGEEKPWISIATSRDGAEMFQHIGDAKKMAVAARKNSGRRMVLMRDGMNYIAKAVHVSLEKTSIAGQTVYCIDLVYTDAPESALRGPEGAMTNPLRHKYLNKKGKSR